MWHLAYAWTTRAEVHDGASWERRPGIEPLPATRVSITSHTRACYHGRAKNLTRDDNPSLLRAELQVVHPVPFVPAPT